MANDTSSNKNGFEPEPDTAKAVRKEGMSPDEERDARLAMAVNALRQAKDTLENIISLLEGAGGGGLEQRLSELVTAKQQLNKQLGGNEGQRTVEGVFDGERMISAEGKSYSVPPNYASKSRLVEGDVLKLTIKPDGTFVYKQIGPVERVRCTGKLAFDESASGYMVVCDDKTYRVLTASVTYFDGQPGDEVVLKVPKTKDSVWAAVENIVQSD
jgi:hypothetical protein